ncbi:hypothetical protein [Comamonas thiooxydans]|uniref:hypothetical protein n=1 Tax=Comamonas thiooxydans TaxID=363952 RepID=UPI0018D4A3CE|nr:hypothetical protein [Comamonas thiooxydans]
MSAILAQSALDLEPRFKLTLASFPVVEAGEAYASRSEIADPFGYQWGDRLALHCVRRFLPEHPQRILWHSHLQVHQCIGQGDSGALVLRTAGRREAAKQRGAEDGWV